LTRAKSASRRAILRRHVEVVRRSLEAFRDGDVEVAIALGHPDIVGTRVDPDVGAGAAGLWE
jgi:ketosteroid isomerase-like protein